VLELKPGIVASSSGDTTVKLWRASTGECLHDLSVGRNGCVYGLLRLGDGMFASGCFATSNINVWSDEGEPIESIKSGSIVAMTRLRDGIVISTAVTGQSIYCRLEYRPLYVDVVLCVSSSIFQLSTRLSVTHPHLSSLISHLSQAMTPA